MGTQRAGAPHWNDPDSTASHVIAGILMLAMLLGAGWWWAGERRRAALRNEVTQASQRADQARHAADVEAAVERLVADMQRRFEPIGARIEGEVTSSGSARLTIHAQALLDEDQAKEVAHVMGQHTILPPRTTYTIVVKSPGGQILATLTDATL